MSIFHRHQWKTINKEKFANTWVWDSTPYKYTWVITQVCTECGKEVMRKFES